MWVHECERKAIKPLFYSLLWRVHTSYSSMWKSWLLLALRKGSRHLDAGLSSEAVESVDPCMQEES